MLHIMQGQSRHVETKGTSFYIFQWLWLRICGSVMECVWFRVPEHECYTRPHHNPSTRTENVKKCKNRCAIVFTVVNGSDSKQVLVYWNVCNMVPRARKLCSATPECFRSAVPNKRTVKTKWPQSLHCSMDLAPNMWFCHGRCVFGIPKHEI
jgi:hypothetical protein